MQFVSNSLEDSEGAGDARKAKKARSSAAELPSSLISVFLNEAGERAGPPIDLPVSSTAKQLQGLINSLLNNDDKVNCILPLLPIVLTSLLLSASICILCQ